MNITIIFFKKKLLMVKVIKNKNMNNKVINIKN